MEPCGVPCPTRTAATHCSAVNHQDNSRTYCQLVKPMNPSLQLAAMTVQTLDGVTYKACLTGTQVTSSWQMHYSRVLCGRIIIAICLVCAHAAFQLMSYKDCKKPWDHYCQVSLCAASDWQNTCILTVKMCTCHSNSSVTAAAADVSWCNEWMILTSCWNEYFLLLLIITSGQSNST